MQPDTLQLAGILIILLPTVAFGGASILWLWISTRNPYYMDNPLRQRMWTAGHAHAGVLLVLSLVALLYVDAADLSDGMKNLVTMAIPASAILVPAAFFLSVAKPDAEKPNGLINLAYAGFISLSVGLLVLGVGLIRAA